MTGTIFSLHCVIKLILRKNNGSPITLCHLRMTHATSASFHFSLKVLYDIYPIGMKVKVKVHVI